MEDRLTLIEIAGLSSSFACFLFKPSDSLSDLKTAARIFFVGLDGAFGVFETSFEVPSATSISDADRFKVSTWCSLMASIVLKQTDICFWGVVLLLFFDVVFTIAVSTNGYFRSLVLLYDYTSTEVCRSVLYSTVLVLASYYY